MSRDSRIAEDPGKYFSKTGSTRKLEIVKLLISAYFTGELTQRDRQEVREEGP